jgi:hypothetical protein
VVRVVGFGYDISCSCLLPGPELRDRSEWPE